MDNILSTLEQILEQRKSASADSSYVSALYSKGTDQILKKIAEESAEVIMATKEGDSDKIIYEVADLWFHTMILLRHQNIAFCDIEEELMRRYGVSGLTEKLNRTIK
jgi:phosphoribosyl-ATP pyrophosphohydrolase